MMLVMLLILTAVAMALWVARRRFLVIVVHGNSMAPTYHDGDRLLVVRRPMRPWRAGDVAVFRRPNRDPDTPPTPDDPLYLVKRVAAVPGEVVPADVRPAVRSHATVPRGYLVVRGDAERSADSRQFGLVPLASTLGVVARPLRTVSHRGA